MAIRIFNTCMGTHLLDSYDIAGITTDIKEGKDSRRICACGHVLAGTVDKCPTCGNTTWTNVMSMGYSRWSKPTDINIKTKDEYKLERIHSDEYSVVRCCLNLYIDTISQTLSITEKIEICVSLASDKMEFRNLNAPIITSNLCDVHEFILKNIEDIEDYSLRENIKRTYEIIGMIVPNCNQYATKVFALNNCLSVNRILTNDNISKHKKFWKEIIDKNRFESGDPWIGKMCYSMDDLFIVCNLPTMFKAYYASKDFRFSYGWYNSKEIDLGQFDTMQTELKDTLKHSIEHQIIYLDDVSQIVNWAVTETQEHMLLLSKFIKRHGMTYANRVFNEFKERLEVVEENGLDIEAVVSPKKFAVCQIEELLTRRKFPQTRIDGFVNCVDNDTFFAIGLLTSKAQLKPNEATKIYK